MHILDGRGSSMNRVLSALANHVTDGRAIRSRLVGANFDKPKFIMMNNGTSLTYEISKKGNSRCVQAELEPNCFACFAS